MMGLDRDAPLDTLIVKKFIYGNTHSSKGSSNNLLPPTHASGTSEKKKRPHQLPAAPPLSSMKIRHSHNLNSTNDYQLGARVVKSSAGKPPLILRETSLGSLSSRSRSGSRPQVIEVEEIPTFTTKTLDQMIILPETNPPPVVKLQNIQLQNPKKFEYK
mmetsp:Transcript_9434/g.14464  ORF Transcript_9434/g.14464 Transcript_9434/m.14464 type:complete len:159 (+) Transcript_9434:1497-1973(+)